MKRSSEVPLPPHCTLLTLFSISCIFCYWFKEQTLNVLQDCIWMKTSPKECSCLKMRFLTSFVTAFSDIWIIYTVLHSGLTHVSGSPLLAYQCYMRLAQWHRAWGSPYTVLSEVHNRDNTVAPLKLDPFVSQRSWEELSTALLSKPKGVLLWNKTSTRNFFLNTSVVLKC